MRAPGGGSIRPREPARYARQGAPAVAGDRTVGVLDGRVLALAAGLDHAHGPRRGQRVEHEALELAAVRLARCHPARPLGSLRDA
jgi:hypothetical protein